MPLKSTETKSKLNTNNKRGLTLLIGVVIGAVLSFSLMTTYYDQKKQSADANYSLLATRANFIFKSNEQLIEIQKELVKQKSQLDRQLKAMNANKETVINECNEPK